MPTKEQIDKILARHSSRPTLPVVEKIALDPNRVETFWFQAIQIGWYPNQKSEVELPSRVLQDKEALDTHMISRLTASWEAITESILLSNPRRSHIINAAIELHKSGNYIASIPLFLSQSDGIAAEELKAHFFTDHEARNSAVDKKLEGLNAIESIILRILKERTPFQDGISKASANAKSLAPNRNGILHGSRKHLDYGTKVNSFKSFSLLAFVSFALSKK